MKRYGAILICLLLAACAPAAVTVPTATNRPAPTNAATQTAYPTYTAQPTYTPNATYTALPTLTPANTVEVTQIVFREITSTPLPASPLPTKRPTSAVTFPPPDTRTPPGPTDVPTAVPPTDVPPTATDIPPTPDFNATEAAINFRAMHNPKFDGNYLVNVDIAPGVWRNDGSASDGTDCYWERLTKQGGIIDNYIGAGNGTMFIDAGDFEVHMSRCGRWTFISQ